MDATTTELTDARAGAVGVPAGTIAACRAAHERLSPRLEAVDDVVVRRPSRLPGWTVGHVLTHLARNADSFVRMLEAAADGQAVAQYPGGRAQRSGEIETGAARSAAAIVNDARSAWRRLDAAFLSAPLPVWEFSSVVGDDTTVVYRTLPERRLREVELHHVDLGLGYEPTDWSDDFVDSTLRMALERLPDRIAEPSQRAVLLAWITGRADFPGGVELAPF